MIGLSVGIYGISLTLVQGVLIRPALRWLGPQRLVVWGVGSAIGVFIAIGMVPSGLMLLVLTPLAALPDFATPALQGIMSDAVGKDEQGELQGVLTSAAALATVLAPLLMTGSFAFFSGQSAPIYFPGAPFMLSALLMVVALLLFLRARPDAAT